MGVCGTSGVFGTEGCGGVLRYRVGVSLTGVYFFWIEPVCVGVGGKFSGGGLLGGVVVRKLDKKDRSISSQESTFTLCRKPPHPHATQ